MKARPRFWFLFAWFFLLLCLQGAVAEGGKFVLFSAQEEPPDIVVAVRASATEKLAAKELRDYLERMTGRKISIRQDRWVKPKAGERMITIGQSELNEGVQTSGVSREQYVMEVTPERLAIVGGKGDSRGVLYGVYDLLEEFGVRWYRPEPWGEHVPTVQQLELPLGRKVSSRPTYEYRSVVSAGFTRLAEKTLDQSEAASRWALRHRLNGSDVGTNPAYGGQFRPVSSHSYYKRIPVEKYFDKHPEYFCLYQGERRKFRPGVNLRPGNPTGLQLCLSNPEVQELFAQSIIEEARAAKDLNSTSFTATPNDACPFCECAECVAMDDPANPTSMSNRVCAFTNIVARKVAAAVPNAKVSLNVYSSWTAAPTIVKKMEPNILIHIAMINEWADYTKTLEAPAPNFNRRILENFERWKQLGVSRIYMYEYWSGYGWKGPMPVVRTMADRLSAYRKFNVRGIYNETCPSWGPQGMELYFCAKLLWNPDLDVAAELERYYQNYYGPAAKPMKAYHEVLMDALEQSPNVVFSGGRGMHLLFTPALVAKLGAEMEQAEALVKGHELYERRLKGMLAGYEVARQVSDILVLKNREGVATESPKWPGKTYLKSDNAEAAYEKLVAYIVSLSGVDRDSVFDISAAPPHIVYMKTDVLENAALGAIANEDKLLKPFTN